jgi:hypothetical protein
MPERQRKLDDKREQREARTSFDVSSKPLHAGRALSLGAAQASRPAPMLYYNTVTIRWCQRGRFGLPPDRPALCD